MNEGAPARLLIVEDEALIAKGIERCVTSRGYVVRDTVDTAEQAISRAAEGIDLVLMDVLLKGPRDGAWAVKAIPAEWRQRKSLIRERLAIRPQGSKTPPVAPECLISRLCRAR